MNSKFWEEPFRMIQPNLRVIDARNLDVKKLVEKVEEYGGNVILANAGGIVSWYESELPYQGKNEYLKIDYVKEILEEAHKKGMKVLLRMDVSKQHEKTLQEHPEWFSYSRDGKLDRHWEMPVTCFNSEYWQEFNFTIIDELMKKYNPDGFFYNSYQFTHCFCPKCREDFFEYSGCSLPEKKDMEDPIWRKYVQYRYEKLARYTQKLRDFIHERNKDAILTIDYFLSGDHPEHLCSPGWSGEKMSRSVDLLSPEAFNIMTRPLPKWIYWAGEEARMGKSADKNIFVLLTYSGIFGSRRSAQPTPQLVFDIMQIAAGGGNPCVALSGDFQQDDRKSLPKIKEVYHFLKRNEKYYRKLTPVSPIALYYSQKTMDFYGKGNSRERALFEYRGFYEAMTYKHFQFDVIHDGMFDFDRLKRYKTLILPNTACLDREEAEAVDAFIREGGNLVATYEAGFYDEEGNRREAPGIHCLDIKVKDTHSLSGAYMAVKSKELFRSFEDVDVVAFEGEFIHLEPDTEKAQILSDLFLIPPVKNNTPEYAYFEKASGEPGMRILPYGKGKVVYLPWQMGKLFHLYGVQEYGNVLSDLLDSLNGERELRTDAPEAVEIRLGRTASATVLHLLNAAGKQSKPQTEVLPVYNLTVWIKSECSKAVSLTRGKELECAREGEYLKIHIPSVDLYEVVAVENTVE